MLTKEAGAMSEPATMDGHARGSAVHWIEAARTEEAARGFAQRFVTGVHGDPAATPSYLDRLGDLSWPLLTGLIADFAHFFEIAHYGWPASARVILARDLGLTDDTGQAAIIGPALTEVGAMRALAIAVGAPSMIGGLTAAENAARSNHMQLQTLLLSERRGCALGTLIAMALAWHPTAHSLNALVRLGQGRDGQSDLPLLSAESTGGPSMTRLIEALGGIAEGAAMRRGLLFGATQALAIRADLWALLARRASMLLAAHG